MCVCVCVCVYRHYTGQPALASTLSKELEDFVGAKFYLPHALADGNYLIQIREKALESRIEIRVL